MQKARSDEWSQRFSELIWAVPTLSRKIVSFHQALEAHTYNPSYLGSRDQGDPGSKPAR
jgi:hypothetical protein